MQDATAEDLVRAILGLTAAVGVLTDAVAALAKQQPPPSSKRKGAKS